MAVRARNDGLSGYHDDHATNTNTNGGVKWRSTRFLLSYLASSGLCVVFLQRVSLSMNIVCMVNHTALHVHPVTVLNGGDVRGTNVTASYNVTGIRGEVAQTAHVTSAYVINTSLHSKDRLPDDVACQAADDRGAQPSSKEDGPFVWDKQTQGLLLAALYVSYTILQIPGSYVTNRFGARLTAGVAVLVMSACNMMCHPAALLSPWAVFALRVVMGVCTALVFPSLYGMWTQWAPRGEQGQLIGITFSGQMVANAFVFPLSALLCRHGFLQGWPSVFHAFGMVGLLWSGLWLVLVTDSPETHPRISPGERHFIVTNRTDVTHRSKNRLAVPWGRIVRSPCFWAIAVAHFTYDWGFYLLMTNIPTFLYETLHFDIQSNGLYSMLPYIALFLVTSSVGFLVDVIIKKRWLSVIAARKVFTSVALTTAAALLVAMSQLGCGEVMWVVVLLTMAVGVSGLALVGGFFINPYDIAPRYAANICTVTNAIACTGGFINPYLVAAITRNQRREEWQVVFYITGGLYVAGAVIFCLLGSGQLQPWALDADHDTTQVIAADDAHLSLQDKPSPPHTHLAPRTLEQ